MESKNIRAFVVVDGNGSEDLWLQILDGDKLLYAHEYLGNGATASGYVDTLKQVKADAENCENYADFEGNDRDDEGHVYDVWDSGYFDVAEYRPESGWQSEHLTDDDLDSVASDVLAVIFPQEELEREIESWRHSLCDILENSDPDEVDLIAIAAEYLSFADKDRERDLRTKIEAIAVPAWDDVREDVDGQPYTYGDYLATVAVAVAWPTAGYSVPKFEN